MIGFRICRIQSQFGSRTLAGKRRWIGIVGLGVALLAFLSH
jgi:hypothetical protein